MFFNNFDRDEDRTVTKEEGEILARVNGMTYVEISSRTGENIDLVFNMMAGMVSELIDKKEMMHKVGVQLDYLEDDKKPKYCCV